MSPLQPPSSKKVSFMAYSHGALGISQFQVLLSPPPPPGDPGDQKTFVWGEGGRAFDLKIN